MKPSPPPKTNIIDILLLSTYWLRECSRWEHLAHLTFRVITTILVSLNLYLLERKNIKIAVYLVSFFLPGIDFVETYYMYAKFLNFLVEGVATLDLHNVM